MAIITPTVTTVAEGVVYSWLGMLGSTVLADCDVGEAIDVAAFAERSIQLAGGWGASAGRFLMEFNSDPDHMPWFSYTPSLNMLLITPGRQFGASPLNVWPATRFFRPRIATVLVPAAPPVDVLLFCLNRV